MKNKIEVHLVGTSKGIFAKAPIKKGDTIISLTGHLVTQPTRYSLQIEEALHLDVPENDTAIIAEKYPWKFLNHSCEPNAHMDVANKILVALKDISAQTEINYNYNTTEYELAEPFECSYNGNTTLVKGYKYLSLEEKKLLAPCVVPHLRALV